MPTSEAPGLVSSGAASHPAASPIPAAASATARFLAISTAVTRPGVPPTALSRPTRRVASAIRPPASTATLATASSPASQAPGFSTCSSACTRKPSTVPMPCHGVSAGAARPVPLYRRANAAALAGCRSVRFAT